VAGYGDRSVLALDTRLIEADALVELGRADEAVEISAAAAELASALLGPEHVNTAYALRSWGRALLAAGEVERGREKLESARAAFEALNMAFEAEVTTERLDQSNASRSD